MRAEAFSLLWYSYYIIERATGRACRLSKCEIVCFWSFACGQHVRVLYGGCWASGRISGTELEPRPREFSPWLKGDKSRLTSHGRGRASQRCPVLVLIAGGSATAVSLGHLPSSQQRISHALPARETKSMFIVMCFVPF